jgi:hypothetical protein
MTGIGATPRNARMADMTFVDDRDEKHPHLLGQPVTALLRLVHRPHERLQGAWSPPAPSSCFYTNTAGSTGRIDTKQCD